MKKTATHDLTVTALFCALMCILSPLSIPTAVIPFSLGVAAVFLVGSFLPPRLATMAVLSYLLLGCFGFPVFSGFRGGADVLFGMTGGFLMAYLPMAWLISMIAKRRIHKMIWLCLSMLVSLLVCYLLGMLWFVFITKAEIGTALLACVLPYIPFDLCKGVLSLVLYRLLYPKLRPMLPKE